MRYSPAFYVWLSEAWDMINLKVTHMLKIAHLWNSYTHGSVSMLLAIIDEAYIHLI